MKYEKIVKAKFIERPNRFVARVIVNGEKAETTVHVKNTGRCKELLVPGCTVYLEDFQGRMGSRKMRYSLVAVEKKIDSGALLINMDSQAPNKVAKEALERGAITIPALGKLTLIKPETVYGSSRFDFNLEGEKGRGYLEVKGCTLEDHAVASFPDAPTQRGVKHIEELINAKKEGLYAGLLFIVQMEGMKYIKPNDETHPEFGEALRRAGNCGVDIMAYECKVSPDELNITNKVKVKL